MKFSGRVGGRGSLSHLRKLWLGGHEFPTKMKIQGGKGPIVDYVLGGSQKSICIKTSPPLQKKIYHNNNNNNNYIWKIVSPPQSLLDQVSSSIRGH